jgi:ribosome-associated protein
MGLIENRDFNSEFVFTATKSSGPGGQHVNKVNTKVELRFSVSNSNLLSEREKQILFEKLNTKLTVEGELIIVAQDDRSQIGNKQKCIEKFYAMLSKSLTPAKKRIASRPTLASKKRRLEGKKLQSRKKGLRKPPQDS